jgi:hypothetical protein
MPRIKKSAKSAMLSVNLGERSTMPNDMPAMLSLNVGERGAMPNKMPGESSVI